MKQFAPVKSSSSGSSGDMPKDIPAFRVTMDDFQASISEEHESKLLMSSFTADYEELFKIIVGKVEFSDDMFG